MDHRPPGAWLGNSRNRAPLRYSTFTPFAAQVLTSNSTVLEQGLSEQSELMARLRHKLDSGQWEPSDSEVLLQLLEQGSLLFDSSPLHPWQPPCQIL